MAHGFKPGDTAYAAVFDFNGFHEHTAALPKSYLDAVLEELWRIRATNIHVYSGTLDQHGGLSGTPIPYNRSTAVPSNYGVRGGHVAHWADYDLLGQQRQTESLMRTYLGAVVFELRKLGATNFRYSSTTLPLVGGAAQSSTSPGAAKGGVGGRSIGDGLLTGGA